MTSLEYKWNDVSAINRYSPNNSKIKRRHSVSNSLCSGGKDYHGEFEFLSLNQRLIQYIVNFHGQGTTAEAKRTKKRENFLVYEESGTV